MLIYRLILLETCSLRISNNWPSLLFTFDQDMSSVIDMRIFTYTIHHLIVPSELALVWCGGTMVP